MMKVNNYMEAIFLSSAGSIWTHIHVPNKLLDGLIAQLVDQYHIGQGSSPVPSWFSGFPFDTAQVTLINNCDDQHRTERLGNVAKFVWII